MLKSTKIERGAPRRRPLGRPISTVTGLLRRAAKVLRAGWTQDLWTTRGERSGRPCFCLDGALREAAGGVTFGGDLVEGANRKLYRAAFRLVSKATGGSVLSWNDQKGRTKGEVLDVVQKAIKLAA